jgi:hypothetical protein
MLTGLARRVVAATGRRGPQAPRALAVRCLASTTGTPASGAAAKKPAKGAPKPFVYKDIFEPATADPTQYTLLTKDHVSTLNVAGKTVLQVGGALDDRQPRVLTTGWRGLLLVTPCAVTGRDGFGEQTAVGGACSGHPCASGRVPCSLLVAHVHG